MASPFRLDEGIFLEDSGILLAWGETPDRLTRLGKPKALSDDFDHVLPQKQGKRLRLVWESRTFFGGLTGVVAAQFWSFSRARPGLDDQTCLHEVLIGVDGLPLDPKKGWTQFLRLMSERLGPAKEAKRGPIASSASWSFAGTAIHASPADRVAETLQFFVRRLR